MVSFQMLVYVAILLLMTGCVQLVLCNFLCYFYTCNCYNYSLRIIILTFYNTLLPGKCSSRLTLSIHVYINIYIYIIL